MRTEDGIVKLSDGSTLLLKVFIVDIRELGGFSPFAGVNLVVNVTVGITVKEVPKELSKRVQDKPVVDLTVPQDGWEMVEIDRDHSRPAVVETEFNSSKGPLLVRAEVEAVMAARNLNYRDRLGEPLYFISWVYKVSWRPKGEGG
ncbi:hypothetical protein [Acidilobus sp.]|uniref:hypothetical protein n=1 Tax=Acidilobus sp. TaxID=1872109 RepID=UPI003CFF6E3D